MLLSKAKIRFRLHIRMCDTPLETDSVAEQARLNWSRQCLSGHWRKLGVNTTFWTTNSHSLNHINWFLFQLAHLLRITSSHAASVDKSRKATEETGDGNAFPWYLKENTSHIFLWCFLLVTEVIFPYCKTNWKLWKSIKKTSFAIIKLPTCPDVHWEHLRADTF